MNILVFSWRGPGHPLAGGAEQVMHEHMKGWIAAGHTVTLFTSSFPNAKPREVIDAVEIIRRGNQMLGVHIAAFYWYVFGKHKAFDFIVDQFHGWPFFTPLYTRKPKLAVIQELTKQVWFQYPLPLGLNFVLGAIGYVAEPLFFLPYRNVHFMTGSVSAREELQTVGIKKQNSTIVPHGVIIQLPKKKLVKEKKQTIIFLGALAKDKGIEDALKTFQLLNNQKRQFWIMGKGDPHYLEFLKGLTKKYGIEKHTTFWGFVSQEKKFELLGRSTVMINPSIREGWGLVNIEANFVGTPVIAYPSQGLVDSVSHNKSGFLVNKSTPQQLASAVEKVFADKKLLSTLSIGAIDWAKQFSWDKSKEKSVQLIEKIAHD
jgi:glycosyltransferase involved in cell wall biosynthesis